MKMFLPLLLAATLAQAAPDIRDFATGSLIPDESYCDQPYIVTTKEGNWVCILTTGAGGEGAPGQHVVATISKDKGKTWSPLIPIEPANGPESSYAVCAIMPSGRIYAFYNYNGDQAKTVEGVELKRPDLGGWFVFRYSDDGGLTWSPQRHRMPMPIADVDLTDNPLKGKFQLFWCIDKPNLQDGKFYMGFTRMRKPVNWYGQGWMYSSTNLMTETDPDKIEWKLTPENNRGILSKEFGKLQEEHNVVPLAGDGVLCVFRTQLGFPAQAVSRDGGKTWAEPEIMRYTPGGRQFKTPTACPPVWKLANGRYLFWFHNTSSQLKGKSAPITCRNLGWLSAGTEKDGVIYWSQPELVNYNTDRRRGCSYPDLVEADGKYYIASTQKNDARVQDVDGQLMADLLAQDELKTVAKNGLAMEATESNLTAGIMPMPALPDLSTGAGFTVDFWATLKTLDPGQVLLDSRDAAGKGMVIATAENGALRFEMNDGTTSASWDSDPGLIKAGQSHHVAFIVDGGPKMISVVIDGLLCDGGADPNRPYGYGRFLPAQNEANKTIGKDVTIVTGGDTLRILNSADSKVQKLRIYNRYLRTSEAVGNFRAGI